MKKVLLCLALTSIAFAQNATDLAIYKKGILEGIKIGRQFEKQRIKNNLMDLKNTIDAVFDYKIYFLKGELPPYLYSYDIKLKKNANGVLEAIYNLIVYPPTYFPVSFLEKLKQDIYPKAIIYAPGFVVYEKTDNLTLNTIAYHYFLAKAMGYKPTYFEKKDILYFASFDREADAQNLVNKLSNLNINANYFYAKDGIKIMSNNFADKKIKDTILSLANLLKQKEEKALYVKVPSKDILHAIYALVLTARDLTNKIDERAYPNFRKYELYRDLDNIVKNLNLYLKYKEEDYQAVPVIDETQKTQTFKKENKEVDNIEKNLAKTNTNSQPQIEKKQNENKNVDDLDINNLDEKTLNKLLLEYLKGN